MKGQLKAFAQMSYAPDLNFCFLDLIASSKSGRSGGVGSALYERVREEALCLNSDGIFLEAMSDDPSSIGDKTLLKQSQSRLKFYENFSVYPVINDEYEKNCKRHYGNPYFLLYDRLNRESLSGETFKKILSAILKRKHHPSCPNSVIARICSTVEDGEVITRPPRYVKKVLSNVIAKKVPHDLKISLTFNDIHAIHHIKERGYVESPVRVSNILNVLDKTDLIRKVKTRPWPDSYITAVHDKDFVNFFRTITSKMEPGKSLYPDVFPIRKEVTPPKKLVSRAGYYCIDVYSPINRNAYLAARQAVNATLTAADELLNSNRISYALVRPPGHHADNSSFGGFCYFNSTAIAAQYFSKIGKVAILDLDYHHGNGQQEIFYHRNDVLTVSIHGDPDFEYPHFSGFKREKGKGEGDGCNMNIPLPTGVTGEVYYKHLKTAIHKIQAFKPQFLCIAFGLDTAKGDPTGSWLLEAKDFQSNGELIGSLNLPTLVVQEGGYNNRVLGINALHFLKGLFSGMYGIKSD